MLTVYCENRSDLLNLSSTIAYRESVVIADGWSEFERHATGTDAAIIGVQGSAPDRIEQYRAFRASPFGPPPVVCIVPQPGNGAISVEVIDAESVIWWEDVRVAFWPALRWARNALPRYRLADEIERLVHLPTLLRHALVHICRSPAPVRSLTMLTRETGFPKSTLEYQWRVACRKAGCDGRLEDFVDWLLLLRALRAKVPRATWSDVATSFEIHEHTLTRLAHRLMSHSLAEATGITHAKRWEIFRERFVDRLARIPEMDG